MNTQKPQKNPSMHTSSMHEGTLGWFFEKQAFCMYKPSIWLWVVSRHIYTYWPNVISSSSGNVRVFMITFFYWVQDTTNNHLITSSKHTPQNSQAFHAMQIAFTHSEDMPPVWSSLLLLRVALRRILEKRSSLKELINWTFSLLWNSY